MLPTSIIEGEGFKNLMLILEPKYKITARSTMIAWRNLIYSIACAKMKERYRL